MNLSTLDLKQILGAVGLLNADQRPETLPRRTFDSVRSLIPTDVISYEAFGNDTDYQGPLWFEPTDNVSNGMIAAMGEYVSDHPIFVGAGIEGMTKALRVSDVVTLPQFKKTAIYNEFFKKLGTDRQLSAVLRISPTLMVSCSLCRLSKDYSERDCAVLDLMTPHLVSAFRNAQFTKRLYQQTEGIFDTLFSANIGLIALDAVMESETETPNARILMTKYFGEAVKALPTDLLDFVKFHRAIFTEDEFYFPPLPLRKVNAHGELIVRILFQSSTKTVVMLFEEISNSKQFDLETLGITKRESEVLHWIGCGKTNQEIAELLGLSVRTIQKHIENIFVKLGVETRTAAASIFFGRPETKH